MDQIVLSPLLQVVLDKLATPFLAHIAIRLGFEKDINELRHTVSVILAVLEDAEEQQVRERALGIWLKELRQVAYDVDDLLDELSFHAIFSNRVDSGIVQQVSSFISSNNMLLKFKEIRDRLDLLVTEKSNFSLRTGVVTRNGSEMGGGKRQTGSFVIESEVFGREEDKEKIVQLLLSNEQGKVYQDISIIPLVGLGGLGKTTLAQLAYNDERVTTHFELRMWVCVNEDFDVRKVMKLIIESATMNRCELLGMDVLQSRLWNLLGRKRYLLVLDDVWNEDHEEWDKLRVPLRHGARGSKIMVTTRSRKVASIMGTVSPHQLQGLADDDCWALFKQRAFCNDEEDCAKLLQIGKQIVKKCGGVPLAAKTLGSLMRFKREEREWLFVQDSDIWNIPCEHETGILPALRLSYSHLPSYLKGCFTYCSVFPRNFVIEKEKLIHLWIAQGLIQSQGERRPLEDIGNEHFNELMWIFFFEDAKKSKDGTITECKMHDLILDLARSVSGNEFIMLEHQDHVPGSLAQTRHSSVVCNVKLHSIPKALYEATKLRTLILLFTKGDLGEVPPDVFSSFRCLRVLDLSGSGLKKMHDSVSCLISLRYLDLSNTLVERLPESICCLCNLQVLNLSGCYGLIELPRRLSSLSNLTHLFLNGCERLTHLPDDIGFLRQLQTLPIFIVGRTVRKSLRQLQGLRLQGMLNIQRLELVECATEGKMANLKGKPKLQSLSLSWGDRDESSSTSASRVSCRVEEGLLEGLQPHQNLKHISIEGYGGVYFPEWISAPELPNLSKIVLVNCKSCPQLPTLGQLPFLEIIHIQGMAAVKNIGREFYGRGTERAFPSLKELALIDFPLLEFWWDMNMRDEFASLVKLTITKCPRLVAMPRFPILQHLELRICNEGMLRSAANLTSLSTLVIDIFTGQLVFLPSLLENNTGLMSLTISSCPKLRSLSSNLGGLTSLKSLTIRWCEELLSLPQELQKLTSLEHLEIIECHNLISLPESMQALSSLQSLSIENCSSITYLPEGMLHLPALKHLTIMYCPNLANLPTDLEHLSSLQSLQVISCPELTSLPEGLQHVTTLQTLEIHGCAGLSYLPEWFLNLVSLRSMAISDCHNIRSLPECLQHLSNVQHLSIRGCPDLEERCMKDNGEDWQKIAHIPYTYIGSPEFVQHNTGSSSSH